MAKFGLMSLFIATAVAGISISSWQEDGLFHLLFFEGFSGWLFWFVFLPSFAGVFCRLKWRWQHGKCIAALILVALLPSLLVFLQQHWNWNWYWSFYYLISRGLWSGIIYSVAPLAVYLISIPLLNHMELMDDSLPC